MDKNEAIRIAEHFISIVNRRYHVENAMMFGSYANGNQRNDSDIDLAIVFQTIDDVIDMQIELLGMRKDDELLIEPHPFRTSDFINSNPVVFEILKNAIPINNNK
jgi:uncharacterized protein